MLAWPLLGLPSVQETQASPRTPGKMTKAESIEALLSPSLRVSRPVAACSRCRGAKIKCDGKLPACTACEKSGKASTCSGANDEFAKGKERSYVAALEAAAERLQRKIAEAKQISSPTTSSTSPGDVMRVPFNGSNAVHSLPPLRQPVPGGKARRKEASDVDDLVGDFGFLSVNATSRDFHGFTSTMSFARLLLSVSMVTDLPIFASNPLPPRYVATSLIQHYLDNIFVLMPFFSETDLMSSVSAVYQDSGRQAKASDHWFVRMVLAISSAAASQNRGDANHQTAIRHVAASLTHVESVIHPGSISGIQALLLLVQYSLMEPEYFRSWDLIGMASRVMVDLGLHVEPAPESRMSKDTVNMRRRVFYCVYTLDRNISIAYGRAFSFTDDSAVVSLPTSATKTSPVSDNSPAAQLFLHSLKPSLFLFDIRRVQSAFYQATHCASRKPWSASTAADYTASILRDIRSWFATIPASLPQRHVFFFRIESLYSQILALSPSCRIPSSNMSDLSKTLIFESAIQYVNLLRPVIEDNKWHPFLTYVDFLRVNAVGRQFREAMRTNFDQLLTGGVAHSPEPSTHAGGVQPPPPWLRSTSPVENCFRAITCLENIIGLLGYARQRWGPGVIREKFAQESAVLIGKLKNRQQELNTPQYFAEDFSYAQSQPTEVSDPAIIKPHSGSMKTTQPFQPFGDAQAATEQSYSTSTTEMQQNQLMRSLSNENPLPYNQQNIQEPQLMRRMSHEDPGERPSMYGLPSGSQPRRSYEFLGGQGLRHRNGEGM